LQCGLSPLLFLMAPRRELAAQRKPSKSEKSLKDKRARVEHETSVVSQVSVLLLCFTSRICLRHVAWRNSNSGGVIVTAAVCRQSTYPKRGLRATWKTKKKTQLSLPYSGFNRHHSCRLPPAAAAAPFSCCCPRSQQVHGYSRPQRGRALGRRTGLQVTCD
jgi:hypothetical protein